MSHIDLASTTRSCYWSARYDQAGSRCRRRSKARQKLPEAGTYACPWQKDGTTVSADNPLTTIGSFRQRSSRQLRGPISFRPHLRGHCRRAVWVLCRCGNVALAVLRRVPTVASVARRPAVEVLGSRNMSVSEIRWKMRSTVQSREPTKLSRGVAVPSGRPLFR